jgi:hypothetical protein
VRLGHPNFPVDKPQANLPLLGVIDESADYRPGDHSRRYLAVDQRIYEGPHSLFRPFLGKELGLTMPLTGLCRRESPGEAGWKKQMFLVWEIAGSFAPRDRSQARSPASSFAAGFALRSTIANVEKCALERANCVQ